MLSEEIFSEKLDGVALSATQHTYFGTDEDGDRYSLDLIMARVELPLGDGRVLDEMILMSPEAWEDEGVRDMAWNYLMDIARHKIKEQSKQQ